MRQYSKLMCVLAVSIAVIAIASPTSAVASDPLPINPTLQPTATPGGTTVTAFPAAPYYWWNVLIPSLHAQFPTLSYFELCELAYKLYNVYPPPLVP